MDKGLTLYVYDSPLGNCSNRGVSSRCKTVTLVDPLLKGPSTPSTDSPAVVLEQGPLNSLRLIPLDLKEQGKWVMFGGAFCTTSDSRFRELLRRKFGPAADMVDAVKLFDRVED